MHNIYWNKVIVIAVTLLFIASSAMGQARPKGNYNFWDFRNKPFYFGLTVGFHSTGFIPSKSRQFSTSDSLSFVSGVSKPGLNLNIITNLKIGQHFDFRFIPGFAFSERRFDFTNPSSQDGSIEEVRVESLFIETPLLLRFKSAPYKDKRLFVMAGIKYSYDVASNSRAREEIAENLMTLSPHDFQFEVGGGVQFFLPFFIFSPEIKYSQGISNIHILNNNLENSRILDKILSRAFTISMHFEG